MLINHKITYMKPGKLTRQLYQVFLFEEKQNLISLFRDINVVTTTQGKITKVVLLDSGNKGRFRLKS